MVTCLTFSVLFYIITRIRTGFPFTLTWLWNVKQFNHGKARPRSGSGNGYRGIMKCSLCHRHSWSRVKRLCHERLSFNSLFHKTEQTWPCHEMWFLFYILFYLFIKGKCKTETTFHGQDQVCVSFTRDSGVSLPGVSVTFSPRVHCFMTVSPWRSGKTIPMTEVITRCKNEQKRVSRGLPFLITI